MQSHTRRAVLAIPVLTVALLTAAASPALADNHVDDVTEHPTASTTLDDIWPKTSYPKDFYPKVP